MILQGQSAQGKTREQHPRALQRERLADASPSPPAPRVAGALPPSCRPGASDSRTPNCCPLPLETYLRSALRANPRFSFSCPSSTVRTPEAFLYPELTCSGREAPGRVLRVWCFQYLSAGENSCLITKHHSCLTVKKETACSIHGYTRVLSTQQARNKPVPGMCGLWRTQVCTERPAEPRPAVGSVLGEGRSGGRSRRGTGSPKWPAVDTHRDIKKARVTAVHWAITVCPALA